PPSHFYTLSLHDALPISFLPSRSFGVRMPFFAREKMPIGERAASSPMATRSSPLLTQFVITPMSRLPKSYWPSPSVLHTSPEPRSEEHTSELQSRGHLVC